MEQIDRAPPLESTHVDSDNETYKRGMRVPWTVCAHHEPLPMNSLPRCALLTDAAHPMLMPRTPVRTGARALLASHLFDP